VTRPRPFWYLYSDAQTATPPPNTRPSETGQMDTRDGHNNTGLWGLLGLTGLLELAGLRRRHDEPVHTYTDSRERSKI
jgi:hypothetical protein